jgi:hypothetical protein
MHQHKRRKKLILPSLQIRLILAFFAVSALGLLLQFLLFSNELAQIVSQLPFDSQIPDGLAPETPFRILAICTVCLLPLMFAIGVLVTFRFAGPLYHFEKHLEAVARGEDPGPCRLRKRDELQELCTKLNAALDRLRSERKAPASAPGRAKHDVAA